MSLLAQVIAALLAYVLQIVLARSLGTEAFGVYAQVLAWTGPLAVLAGAGLPAAAVRFLPAFAARGDDARAAGFVRAAERVVLAIAVGIAAAGSALALTFAHDPSPFLVGLWTIPLSTRLSLRTEIARASGRYEAAFLVPLLQPLAMLCAALAMKAALGAITPALGLCLPAVGVLLVLAWQRRGARAPSAAAPTYETRAWLGASLGILAVDAAHLLLSQADALLVGALHGGRAVALLGVAGATASFSMFPMIAVGATAVPAFAGPWALGRRDELERLAQRAVRRAFTAQVLLALGVLALAKPVLALYGADFEEARLPLVFVLAGQLANTGTGYVGSLMTMTGHQAVVGRSIWIAAALNVALVLAGAHLFGVTGAAAGTAISSLGYNLWLRHLVVRHVGVRASFADALLATLRERRTPWSNAVATLPDSA